MINQARTGTFLGLLVITCIASICVSPIYGKSRFEIGDYIGDLEVTGPATGKIVPGPVPGSLLAERIGKGPRLETMPLVSTAEAKQRRDTVHRIQRPESDRAAIEITEEIYALARGCLFDPVMMYEYVRNNIDYVPMYGSLKGATMTYLDGCGSDFDQASLLIALLRASGFTATYIYGTIQVTGCGDGCVAWR